MPSCSLVFYALFDFVSCTLCLSVLFFHVFLSGQGKLPALADNDEVLHFIEQIGVDELAIAGGFSRADIINL